MGRSGYKDILEHNLTITLDNFGLAAHWVSPQGNISKHRVHIFQDWLRYYALSQINLPSQLLGENPIEHT